ncbi:hypothetical protein VTI74DRAFT_1816 [Chaetomium olivicolor]
MDITASQVPSSQPQVPSSPDSHLPDSKLPPIWLLHDAKPSSHSIHPIPQHISTACVTSLLSPSPSATSSTHFFNIAPSYGYRPCPCPKIPMAPMTTTTTFASSTYSSCSSPIRP